MQKLEKFRFNSLNGAINIVYQEISEYRCNSFNSLNGAINIKIRYEKYCKN